MKKAPPNHRGFALMEIIISIGVLAVVSMFILEMFVRAANIGNRARDKDMAALEAQTVLSLCREDDTAQSLSARWDRPVRARPDGTWEACYDEDWNPVEAPADKGFVLSLAVTPDETALGAAARGAWDDITVSVIKLGAYPMEDGDHTEIFRLTAGRYRAGGR